MTQIGSSYQSFKPEGIFRGMTTLGMGGPGAFMLLENCYVSSDGREIRSMPGFKTFLDPVSGENDHLDPALDLKGYTTLFTDARRPILDTSNPDYTFQLNWPAEPSREQLYCWTRVKNLHAIEQVRGRWVIVGESDRRRAPIYNAAGNAWIYVTAYEFIDSFTVELTFDQDALVAADAFNTLTTKNKIGLESLTGGGASVLNGGTFEVSSIPAANKLRIIASIGSAANNASGQTGLVYYATDDDTDELTIWVTPRLGRGNGNPPEVVYPSHVANRMRDFGDHVGTIKEGRNSSLSGRSRRRQSAIPRRVVPCVAGNRLLMAVPGYNCVFQAPMVRPIDYETNETGDASTCTHRNGLHWIANDIYDRPRMLGVPKGVMWEDPDKTIAASVHFYDSTAAGADYHFGGSANASRQGIYKFRIAYYDEATDEIGELSEAVVLQTDGTTANQGVRLYIYPSAYIMHESLALNIRLYRTARNGEAFFFDRNVRPVSPLGGGQQESIRYGLTPNTVNQPQWVIIYDVPYTTDAVLTQQKEYVPILERPPMGCNAVRTIRGWTFFGGTTGERGKRLELIRGTSSLAYDPTVTSSQHVFHDELFHRGPQANQFTHQDGTFGGSSCGIPSSYAGQTLLSRRLFPYPVESAILDTLRNVVDGDPGSIRAPSNRWKTLVPLLKKEKTLVVRGGYESWLALPGTFVQISEQDNPGVTPATSIKVVSNEFDERIEAIGDFQGQAVICSRSKTYVMGWSQSPVEAEPDIANDRFGCIAPNSMVSFDGGTAWISDRGPVAMTGNGMQYIGQDLEKFFVGDTSRYLRDGEGMMRHAFGCHDPFRGLIYFGVYRGRDNNTLQITVGSETANWAQATNGMRSRWPCDEILVYSYRVGAWSIWVPPIPLLWMTQGMDDDGRDRIFALGFDRRIYGLDDTYGQWNYEPPVYQIAENAEGTTMRVPNLGTDVLARGNSSSFVTPGMDVLLIRRDRSLIGVSRVVSYDPVTELLVLEDAFSVKAGDYITVGCRVSRIVTQAINVKGSASSQVHRAGMRYSLSSRFTANGNGVPQPMAARMVAIANKRVDRQDGGESRGEVALSSGGPQDYQFIGFSDLEPSLLERTFHTGSMQGQNHQLDLVVIGGGQIRIEDLYVEVR